MTKKIAFFCTMALVIFILCNSMFTPSWNYPIFSGYIGISINELKKDKNAIDVFFLGSSHSECAISPMQLYEDYGMLSYNISTSIQSIEDSEYFVKKIFSREHKPSLIVMDVSPLFYDASEQSIRYVTDVAPFDSAKYQLIDQYLNNKHYKNEIKKWEEKISFLIPFFRYHARWDELKYDDFIMGHGTQGIKTSYFTQGWAGVAGIYEMDNTYEQNDEINENIEHNQEILNVSSVGDTKGLSSKNAIQYNLKVVDNNKAILRKIKQICDDNNCELLLVKVPLNASAASYGSSWGNRRHEAVSQCCEEMGIDFIDFNYENVGIDWAHDTFDGGVHQNVRGALKTTATVGEYITNHYDIAPVENAIYNNKLQLYHKYITVLNLESAYEFKEYLSILQDSNKTILISAKDDMTTGLSNTEKKMLHQLGLESDFDEMRKNDSFLAIIDNGEVIIESSSNRQQYYNKKINGDKIEITSAGFLDGNNSSIKVNGTEYSMNGRGLNFVVIDNESGLVIDRACCDTFEKEHEVYHDIGSLNFEYNEYLLGRK